MAEVRRIQQHQHQQPQHSGLNVNDILFPLFKHKGSILFLTLVGLAAGVAVYFRYPPIYESHAKLLVRYVLERSAVDPISESQGSAAVPGMVINTEVEILTSWDLALQVAEVIGPKKMLPKMGDAASKEAAAGTISSGLHVAGHTGSNIILVSYKNQNQELATQVLNELVNRYFNKHLEVHRSAGAFDFVTQQTDQVRARLSQTEDALKALKNKAGVVSLAAGTTALNNELTQIHHELQTAEGDLAEQRGRVKQLEDSVPGKRPLPPETGDSIVDVKSIVDIRSTNESSSNSSEAKPAVSPAPDGEVRQYQNVVSELAQLRKTEQDLLAKYTPKNVIVESTHKQIAELESEQLDLEKKFPDLPRRVQPVVAAQGQHLDLASETARLAGMEARSAALRSRLSEILERMKQFSDIGQEIGDLERNKELEETNYKYFANTLEKARIDEALDPSKIPNISAVQRPSAPVLVTTTRDKIALGLCGGGLALGIVIALLRELVLNQTVRRPSELETRLQVPLLLSIPYHKSSNGRRPLPLKDKADGSRALVPRKSNNARIAPWDANHFMRPYFEAIRDRVNLYFELNSLTHKPKLVGVTGFSDGAGASTLATGLAAVMSETDGGKVLLVDVTLGPEDVHPFFKGKPAYPLRAALQSSAPMHSAADNLYLATVSSNTGPGPAQLGLKKFFELMPNLRASDFDYIIFDMPALGSTSPTAGMAGFMDKLLLVVEAEKDNRNQVARGYKKLAGIRDNISVIVNKIRSYLPQQLED
jgi:polysaccharide biosynthesis transport protein